MVTNPDVVERHRPIIDEIKKRTVEVAAAHQDYLAAWTADRDAHAELLAAVVHVVKPALPALGSRVIVGAETGSFGTSTNDAAWRGVPLLTDTGEPFGKPRAERSSDAARGRFAGRTLFLDTHGSFIEIGYSGTWSTVEGEVTKWKATSVIKSAVAVASEWEVDAILDRIAQVLRQQTSGSKDDRTAAMTARADRISALAKLARAL